MFSKILIANRGEIACRIIRTARRLGVRTVAVYSDADAEAQHRKLADEAVHIGPSPARESYLSGEKIIAAALATGAEAIHPGYGFLSENPDFVDAVEKAGLVFIGPSAASIRAMGLKDAAKRLMEKAGVPVVPGYHGDNQDAGFLAGEADRIGYPVLIKASAGGGGKGMRRVDQRQDFAAALESCRREAKSSFGDDKVLIEKYILSPRHIEVQVFGDAHGHIVHLFERDCSLQRRHQKVIEEAPAPGMSEAVRAAMTGAAVKAAEAVNYRGAGTIEFIADGSGSLRPDGFWFMEMNTRLQVEHPVTEAITGFDLVEWQLRVASGEALPVSQEQIHIHGHAVEARLYAEDPAGGFLPQAGRIEHLGFGAGEGVRIDGGVIGGDAVSPFYDPMIAKVIAHGATRDAALDRLGSALGETHIAGLATNRDFLRALSVDATFRAGRMDTGLIERDLDALLRKPEISEEALLVAALAALEIDPQASHAGFRHWGEASRRIVLLADGEQIERRVVSEEAGYRLVGGAAEFRISGVSVGAPPSVASRHLPLKGGEREQGGAARPISPLEGEMPGRAEGGATATALIITARTGHDGTSAHLAARVVITPTRVGKSVSVLLNGETFVFLHPDPLSGANAAHGGSGDILAPMTGVVRLVEVKAGDVVKAGDRLLVMEAMKMEHTLKAPRDAVVDAVLVAEGGQAEGGAVLVKLKDAADG
ncbi:acetyl/propionyl/methylcrotonyl-CoA carboxylase subunit alpha [Rhizobium sp. C4]|uniref:acetyl/propionyl/methylcrotonyl-CoA carboxylase subunit alpha n=1 Tax=Rhizobium sp. C4 TaxID=1349800 RepID=UPI002E7B327B|nr:acetyl/propionyl/methylcrotonyl-CoA carboxylase subunit alpha [Rhizobium sp. C4]